MKSLSKSAPRLWPRRRQYNKSTLLPIESKALMLTAMRVFAVMVLVTLILAPVPLPQVSFASVASAFNRSPFQAIAWLYGNNQEGSKRAESYAAARITLRVKETRSIKIDGGTRDLIVLDPEKLSAELKGDSVLLTGLETGSTTLIISGASTRQAYAVDITRPISRVKLISSSQTANRHSESLSGFYRISFSSAFDGQPNLWSHQFDVNRQLSEGRVLRLSGELFNYSGSDGQLPFTGRGRFGTSRLTFGIDSPQYKLDLIDSDLNLSQVSFQGYVIRGPHLVFSEQSRFKGLEMFYGIARPSTTLFGKGSGRVYGAILPIAQSQKGRFRIGMININPRTPQAKAEGGVVWMADGRYSIGEQSRVEGEVEYANGGISGRAFIDLQVGRLRASVEASRLDRRSPFISIGAQTSNRNLLSTGLQWRASSNFSASFNFSRSTVQQLSAPQRGALANSQLTAAAYYRNNSANLSLRFGRQGIESISPSLRDPINLNNRYVEARYKQSFSAQFSNFLSVRITNGSEDNSKVTMSRGLIIQDHLRYKRGRWFAEGFIKYSDNTTSLESLIVRNPGLLPPVLRSLYEQDPERFFSINRDVIAELFPSLDIPLTSSIEGGFRFRAAFSRYSMTGELRYGERKVSSGMSQYVLATYGFNARLNAANSIQVQGSRLIPLGDSGARSSLTVSFTHLFGAPGGGFNFRRLFGLGRSEVNGRAYLDLNRNGIDDVGEPGISGMEIQLSPTQSTRTDGSGRYRLASVSPGSYETTILSERIGRDLRAVNPLQQLLTLMPGQKTIVNFGFTNTGSLTGKAFNDLFLTGEFKQEFPGVDGVGLILRPIGAGVEVRTILSKGDGSYEAKNLPTGDYLVEVDPLTLPANFQLKRQDALRVSINPFNPIYVDIPLVAQRAVSGIIFVDKDNDGKFNPQIDGPLANVRVSAGAGEAVTDYKGRYFLKNLPAGKLNLRALRPTNGDIKSIIIELGESPSIQRNVDFSFAPD